MSTGSPSTWAWETHGMKINSSERSEEIVKCRLLTLIDFMDRARDSELCAQGGCGIGSVEFRLTAAYADSELARLDNALIAAVDQGHLSRRDLKRARPLLSRLKRNPIEPY